MTPISGGELVARTLADAGVTRAFGVHGGHLDAALAGLRDRGVRLVDTRHEAPAGHAAEAWSLATGELGVAFATSGPGFTNAYTAMANAHLDRVPVLFLTSSPPLREDELNVLQGGIDQVAAAGPVTRWAHRATTVARIPAMVAQAVRHAHGGVPGPVLVDVPIDLMFRTIDEDLVERPRTFRAEPAAPSRAVVERTAALLAGARRPVLVLGAGAARTRGGREALRRLLDLAPVPVAMTSSGMGTLPDDTPEVLGTTADLAVLSAAGRAPDLLVLLGTRRGMALGGRSTDVLPGDATVVHVDSDPAELGRIGSPDLAVVADVAQFCLELADHLARSDAKPDLAEWGALARETRGGAAAPYADAPELTASGRLHPFRVCQEIWEHHEPGDVMVTDGGESSGWMSYGAHARGPGEVMGIGMLGGLGIGTGFSIGAQVARPDRRVVAVTGDGAMGFHLQEWETMVRHRLPIVTVVINNLGWGMSFHGQEAMFGGKDTHLVSDLPDIRYDRIAASFGCHGERVDRLADIGPALARAKASGLPACIDVAVAPDVVHPMMQPLSAPLAHGETRIPYYEPLPRGEV